MNLKELRTSLENKKGMKQAITNDIAKAQTEIDRLQTEIDQSNNAQQIIQIVAEQTQSELEYQIGELVSLGMEYVFEDPYSISLKFIPKRGKTDCVLSFSRNGRQFNPLDQSGFGTIDIGGFGFRIAFLGMSDPKPRPILLLDEPFKHIKGAEDNVKAIQMVSKISKELGLQIIMVSDERVPLHEISRGADRIFRVTQNKGVSEFEMIDV